MLQLIKQSRVHVSTWNRDYCSSFFSKKYEIIKQKQYSSLVDTVYMVDYYKINVLLVESSQKERLNCEDYHILDEQDCLIEF